jgi:hypothetical protein
MLETTEPVSLVSYAVLHDPLCKLSTPPNFAKAGPKRYSRLWVGNSGAIAFVGGGYL